MLKQDQTLLLLIDIQGKLAELMHGKEDLYQNLRRITMGAKALNLPILWLEQIPEKMGPTITELRELLPTEQPIPKKSFSCCGEPAFMSKLQATGRKQVMLAGIEAHVCVFQTAADLLQLGYEVHVVADAVSSRTPSNRQTGLDRIRNAGGEITSVESALFELTRTAEHPAFRDLLKIIR